MRQDWVKAHSSLCRGKWRGVPRATRFLLLELAIETRPTGGILVLPHGVTDPVEAIVDIVAGRSRRERREVRDGARYLLGSGTLRFNSDLGEVAISKFASWNSVGSSAERMRAKRERERAAAQSPTDTPDSDVTRDSHCDALEERRGEESRSPCSPPLGDAPEQRDPKPGKPKRRGSAAVAGPLRDDWRPNAQHIAMANASGLCCADEEADFRDWTAARGQLYADWDAGFRSHLRRQAKRVAPAEPPLRKIVTPQWQLDAMRERAAAKAPQMPQDASGRTTTPPGPTDGPGPSQGELGALRATMAQIGRYGE